MTGIPITGRTVIPFWRQIRWRLIGTFLLLAVIPSLVTSLSTSSLALQSAQDRVIAQLESVADLKQHQLDSWLSNSTAMLHLVGRGPIGEQIKILARATSASGADADALGTLLAQTVEQTKAADAGQPRFRALFVYRPDGLVITASDPALMGRVVTRQPYFAQSLGGDYIQTPYYEVGKTELAMVMTTPVLSENGAVVAILAGELNLSTLGEIMLDRSGLSQSGETYLVSKESGYLLTPSRFEGYPLARAYRSVGIDRGLRGESGSGLYDDYREPAVEVVGVYRWVPSMQAALLAEIDREEAFATAVWLRQVSLFIMFGASILALLLGLFVAERIGRPIANLTRIAGTIAGGDLSERSTVRGRDEIGILGASFNTMADRVQDAMADLEQRIAERTAALQNSLSQREEMLAELQESSEARNALQDAIRRTSSPVLPVLDGVLVMPLVGIVDEDRAGLLMSTLLTAIETERAHTLILDVTGVPIVDTQVAAALIRATEAARLLGAESVLVGIRPELAQTIVSLGVDLSSIYSEADLRSGIMYAANRARRQSANSV